MQHRIYFLILWIEVKLRGRGRSLSVENIYSPDDMFEDILLTYYVRVVPYCLSSMWRIKPFSSAQSHPQHLCNPSMDFRIQHFLQFVGLKCMILYLGHELLFIIVILWTLTITVTTTTHPHLPIPPDLTTNLEPTSEL